MNKTFTGKIPKPIKQKIKNTDRKFKSCYDAAAGHYLVNRDKYTAKQAAELAVEAGYILDIYGLEDIRQGYAAFRFNGLSPSGYTEVDEGARGSFPVWIMPVFFE